MMDFKSLSELLMQIPAIGSKRILAHGDNGQQAWWIKFSIDLDHPLAWQCVQELGHVLNYLSTDERLPTRFLPVSPPPYMNGTAQQFLSWVIECNHADFSPAIIAEWLDARLPQPLSDPSAWHISTTLDEQSH